MKFNTKRGDTQRLLATSNLNTMTMDFGSCRTMMLGDCFLSGCKVVVLPLALFEMIA